MLAELPTAPENLKTAFNPRPAVLGRQGDELKERFNAWLAK